MLVRFVVYDLHVGESVFGPAVNTLDLLARNCCLRIISIVIASPSHEFV